MSDIYLNLMTLESDIKLDSFELDVSLPSLMKFAAIECV